MAWCNAMGVRGLNFVEICRHTIVISDHSGLPEHVQMINTYFIHVFHYHLWPSLKASYLCNNISFHHHQFPSEATLPTIFDSELSIEQIPRMTKYVWRFSWLCSYMTSHTSLSQGNTVDGIVGRFGYKCRVGVPGIIADWSITTNRWDPLVCYSNATIRPLRGSMQLPRWRSEGLRYGYSTTYNYRHFWSGNNTLTDNCLIIF